MGGRLMSFPELSRHQQRRIVFFVIVLLFLTGISFFLYTFYVVVDVQVIPMDVNFTGENKVAGFNLDTDKLHFGDIPPESPSAYRTMTFTNIYPYPVTVTITADGEMAEWIRYEYSATVTNEKLTFSLQPEEIVSVRFLLDLSQRPYTVGVSEGELRFVIQRNVDFFS